MTHRQELLSHSRGRSKHLLRAGLLLFALDLSGQAPSGQRPAVMPIDYPIAHYAREDDESYALWQAELRAFRKGLRAIEAFPDSNAALATPGRDRQFLDEHDPRRQFFRNPLNFFSAPPLLSWIEEVDENGIIQKINVVSSNQSISEDRRIIEYCLAGKRWRPAKTDGVAVPTLRATNLVYGDSRWVFSFWWKALDDEQTMALVVFLVAGLVGGLWVLVGRIRRRSRPSSGAPL